MGIVVVIDDEMTFAVVRKVCDEAGLNAAHARTAESAAPIDPSVVIATVPEDRDPLEWLAELRRTLPGAFVAVVDDSRNPVLADAADIILECPLDEVAVASALQAAMAHRRAPTTPPHVRTSLLVVEPDPGLSVVMKRWLGHAYDVTIVATGKRALDELSIMRADAVLCELYLPDMDASELYGALDEIEPGLSGRILFMSGGLIVDQTRHFLARIPGRWIAKPFTLAQLRAALERL